MLNDPAWRRTDQIARTQLGLFHDLSDRIKLSPDDRRRALNLDDGDWHAWHDFLRDGPLPRQPAVSDMLCRLGRVTFNLAVVAEG